MGFFVCLVFSGAQDGGPLVSLLLLFFCFSTQVLISTYFWNARIVGLSGQSVSTDVVERAGLTAATLTRAAGLS